MFEHERARESKGVVFGCLLAITLANDRQAVIERSQELVLVSFINQPANGFVSSLAHESCARTSGAASSAASGFFHAVPSSVQP